MSTVTGQRRPREFGPWYIRRRAIGLLLLILLVSLGALYGLVSLHVREMIEHSVEDDLSEAGRIIDGEIERERRKMLGKLQLLLRDDDLMSALAAQDRLAIKELSGGVMATLRRQGVSHLYFLDPDLKVLFRAHQPGRFGDRIARISAREAKRRMQAASAVELGPLGTLTLRVVIPALDQGRLLGFVEMGKEMTTIIHDVQQDIGFLPLIAIPKGMLSKAQWHAGHVIASYHYPWDTLEDFALMDFNHGLDMRLYANLVRQALADGYAYLTVQGGEQAAAAQSLASASGAGIRLVVALDVGEVVASGRRLMRQAMALMLGLFAVGVVLVISLLSRADKRLFAYHDDLEREVSRQTAELAASNRELESFSYAVSHDLRAPLRSMDGFAEAVLQDYGDTLDANGREYLQRIRAASQRMGQMIDALLRLSRVGRRDMTMKAVDLSAILAKALQNLREREPERHVEASIQPGITVQGDWMLLSIAIENLLSNAWKFTVGRDPARIEFGARQGQGELICWIRDNGAGFDAKYADKLFGAFQRLHAQDEFEGIGIGLATVQRIISRHGGRVWAEGTPDQGATFYFALPHAKAANGEDA